MANTPQSRKRARQAITRRARTVVHMSRFRTYTKKVRAALVQGDADKAKLAYGEFVKIADSAATKRIIHKNKAARLKRNLSAAVKALSSSRPAPQPAQEGGQEAG